LWTHKVSKTEIPTA